MNETIADRIRQRLAELGLSARAASMQAGASSSAVRNILDGKSSNPRSDTLAGLARVLKVTPQWLLSGEEPDRGDAAPPAITAPTDLAPNARPAPDLPLPHAFNLPRDLPALGTAAGSMLGNGAFQLSTDTIDFLRRPPALLGVRDAYALYVEGDSMSPRFEPGDPIFVHPHRKAKPGDYIVIQEPDGSDDERRAYVKRLVKIAGNLLRVEQFNPRATIDFVIRDGLVWHKVLTDADLWSF